MKCLTLTKEIYKLHITYQSQFLQNVQLAHGTGPVLYKPWINTQLVKNMPEINEQKGIPQQVHGKVVLISVLLVLTLHSQVINFNFLFQSLTRDISYSMDNLAIGSLLR